MQFETDGTGLNSLANENVGSEHLLAPMKLEPGLARGFVRSVAREAIAGEQWTNIAIEPRAVGGGGRQGKADGKEAAMV